MYDKVYLLKVASFDVGILYLSEVGKAVVVTRVRLHGRKITTYKYKYMSIIIQEQIILDLTMININFTQILLHTSME